MTGKAKTRHLLAFQAAFRLLFLVPRSVPACQTGMPYASGNPRKESNVPLRRLSGKLVASTHRAYFHERVTDAQPACKLGAAFCSIRRYDAQQSFEHVILQYPASWHPVLPENSYHTLSCRQPFIMMMQATDFWKLYYLSKVWQLHRSRFRTVHPQRQMRAPAMIIFEIAHQDSFQMTIVQHDNMIQAITEETRLRA